MLPAGGQNVNAAHCAMISSIPYQVQVQYCAANMHQVAWQVAELPTCRISEPYNLSVFTLILAYS